MEKIKEKIAWWETRLLPLAIAGCLLMNLLFLPACTTHITEPILDLEPQISLLEQSATTLKAFEDKLVITISYEDGDGDLGNPDPDINSIFVKDARLEKADEYYLSPLAPEDARISISGTLQLELSTTFVLGNGTEEKTRFSIHFVDRSGNQSNTLETDEITIIR